MSIDAGVIHDIDQFHCQLLLLSGRAGDAGHDAVELAELAFVNRVPRSFNPLLPLFAERGRYGSRRDRIFDSHSWNRFEAHAC